jgi:hypothetical protein
MGWLGIPEARERPGSKAGTLIEENRQFLAEPAEIWYCFSERPIDRFALLMGWPDDRDFGAKGRE